MDKPGLTIERWDVAMYLDIAAIGQEAQDAAYKFQAQRYNRKKCSARRGEVLWEVYWICLQALHERVRDLREKGGLLMFGCAPAMARAREIEAERDRQERQLRGGS